MNWNCEGREDKGTEGYCFLCKPANIPSSYCSLKSLWFLILERFMQQSVTEPQKDLKRCKLPQSGKQIAFWPVFHDTIWEKFEMGEGCFKNKFSWYCQWKVGLTGNTFLMKWCLRDVRDQRWESRELSGEQHSQHLKSEICPCIFSFCFFLFRRCSKHLGWAASVP